MIKLYWLKMLRESQPALLLGKEKGEELGRESSNHQLWQEGTLFQCAPLNPCLYCICRVISHVIETTGDVNNYTIIFSHFFFSQLHCVTSHHIFLCLKKATKACSLRLFGDFFEALMGIGADLHSWVERDTLSYFCYLGFYLYLWFSFDINYV